MNINQNIGLNSRPNGQRKDRGCCNFACIHSVISNLSVLCSSAGASLFGAIFFGVADALDYRNTKLIYECAHYMVIAAVVLFFLALLLSFFKEDSKQNDPIVANQTNVGESAQFEKNRIAKISTNSLNLPEKLKLGKSNTKVNQDEISGNIKPIDMSSKISKIPSLNEQEKSVSRALRSSSSCKNLHTDQSKQRKTASTSPQNISSKTHNHAGTSKKRESKRTASAHSSSRNLQHAGTSKQQESANILSPNISSNSVSAHTSSRNLQHGSTSKQQESANILSPNISSKALQKSSTFEQCDSGKASSPNISSKIFQHAGTSEQKAKTLTAKPRSQSMSEKPSHFDQQLVPYEKRPKIPFYVQNVPTSPHQAGNFCEFMPPNASGYSPVTEVTATKRMTVAPWGVTQEECQIHRRTSYRAQGSMGGLSPQYVFTPIFGYNPNSGGIQQYQINQTTFYQYPPYVSGNISSNEYIPKFDSAQN